MKFELKLSMLPRPLAWITALATVSLAGCGSLPQPNAQLDQAHADYRTAQASTPTRDLAAPELKQAADAMARADSAWSAKADEAQVDHLAYLARQRIAIAQETGQQRSAEQAVAAAGSRRDQLRLAARTQEADSARRDANSAQRDATLAQRDATLAQRDLATAQQQTDMAARQAGSAQARNRELEAQMKEMNAKQTDRGIVVTVGDVLFDTGRSELKSGGVRNMEQLVGFLKQYPLRKAMIEGYTDSVGGEASNQELSGRRAEAVRSALLDRGIGADRLATRGYGEAFPVATNASAGGRQMNRRVEIVLSDDSGTIAPR